MHTAKLSKEVTSELSSSPLNRPEKKVSADLNLLVLDTVTAGQHSCVPTALGSMDMHLRTPTTLHFSQSLTSAFETATIPSQQVGLGEGIDAGRDAFVHVHC